MVFEQPFDELRLKHPLKRMGDRGEGKWEQISWDQALDEIAERITGIVADRGAEAIAGILDCAISTGFATRRFVKKLGSPNWFQIGGQVCYTNSARIEDVTYGHDTICDRANSKCTVIWGSNPSISKPEWFRNIKESKKKGGKVIAVDPLKTESVDIADIWLRIRPGSDGAMMLAWLNVIVNEKLYDEPFVEKWTNAPYLVMLNPRRLLRQTDLIAGSDPEKFLVWDNAKETPVAFDLESMEYEMPEVKPPLTGQFKIRLLDGSLAECTTVWSLFRQAIEPYTPGKVAEITWVPAEKIREAARMFANNQPGNIFAGYAMDAIGRNSNQLGRARCIMSAILGNLDVKGGQVILGPYIKINTDPGTLSPEQAAKVIGGDRFRLWTQETTLKMFKYQKRVNGYPGPSPFYSAHGPSVWRAMISGYPYPVKGLIVVGGNPLITGGNARLVEQALRKLDLLVVHELYMTPTAELADYVTPAAMDDIETCRLYSGGTATGGFEGHGIFSGEKAIDPPGEARSDFVFVRELGVRLGQDWPWKTDEEYYDWQVKPLGYSSFDEFHKKVQWILPEPTYKKYEKAGFGTPSGKVEIYSSILEELNYNPLPDYEEPPNSPYSKPDLWKEYPYVQGMTHIKYHYQSSCRSLASLRSKAPDPLVRLNADVAATHGFKDGDWVWIESPSAPYKVKQKVKIVNDLDPRVIIPDFGWWFPEKSVQDDLHGAWESNINVLTGDDPDDCCPMIGSWYLNANLLKITKIEQ
jgi:anaerobic selenocysteine-containing dehydrogenase